MAKHGPHVPQALGAVIQQVVLYRRAHAGSRALGAQGELLAIERVGEGIHFLFDNVRHFANRPMKQSRRLDHGHAYRPIAVGTQPVTDRLFKLLPQFGLNGQ